MAKDGKDMFFFNWLHFLSETQSWKNDTLQTDITLKRSHTAYIINFTIAISKGTILWYT